MKFTSLEHFKWAPSPSTYTAVQTSTVRIWMSSPTVLLLPEFEERFVLVREINFGACCCSASRVSSHNIDAGRAMAAKSSMYSRHNMDSTDDTQTSIPTAGQNTQVNLNGQQRDDAFTSKFRGEDLNCACFHRSEILRWAVLQDSQMRKTIDTLQYWPAKQEVGGGPVPPGPPTRFRSCRVMCALFDFVGNPQMRREGSANDLAGLFNSHRSYLDRQGRFKVESRSADSSPSHHSKYSAAQHSRCRPHRSHSGQGKPFWFAHFLVTQRNLWKCTRKTCSFHFAGKMWPGRNLAT